MEVMPLHELYSQYTSEYNDFHDVGSPFYLIGTVQRRIKNNFNIFLHFFFFKNKKNKKTEENPCYNQDTQRIPQNFSENMVDLNFIQDNTYTIQNR
jgi:hypothetical protein